MSETSVANSSPSNTRSSMPDVVRAGIALGARLEIRDVEEVHRALLDSLNREGSLTIDVSKLTAIDTAGVQLLLAVRCEGVRRGLAVELCGVSGVLDRASSLLGVCAALGRAETV
jgi:ABC-type transporter Mla MlaB component